MATLGLACPPPLAPCPGQNSLPMYTASESVNSSHLLNKYMYTFIRIK